MADSIRKCRCCGREITGAPKLSYKNMPALAQNFPTADEVKNDKSIDLDVFQCMYCGLVQVCAEPVSYYRDVIRAVAISDDMKQFRHDNFADFVNGCNLHGKRLLEIGAGCGEYMQMMAENDVEVVGLEHLKASVEKANASGLKVYEGFIEDALYKVPDGPYDGFFIMNFLEHIPNPVEFMIGIANNIKEGAYGLVEVPSGDGIFKEHAFSAFMLDHLSYFTVDTLRTLLSLAGFEIISCEVILGDYILSAVVRKRLTIDVEGFAEREKKVVDRINNFINQAKENGKKVAVWGAGHESLSNIALSDISDKIECVLDSAPFKQNKYTPATHIPVVAPSEITTRGIGAVIVMCANYSDEVERIVKEQYPGVDTLKVVITD